MIEPAILSAWSNARTQWTSASGVARMQRGGGLGDWRAHWISTGASCRLGRRVMVHRSAGTCRATTGATVRRAVRMIKRKETCSDCGRLSELTGDRMVVARRAAGRSETENKQDGLSITRVRTCYQAGRSARRIPSFLTGSARSAGSWARFHCSKRSMARGRQTKSQHPSR